MPFSKQEITITFETTVEGPNEYGKYHVPGWGWRTREEWAARVGDEKVMPSVAAMARAVVEVIDAMTPPAWRNAQPGDLLDVRIDGGEWVRALVQGSPPYWLSTADGGSWAPWVSDYAAARITDSRMVLRAGEVPSER